MRKFNSLKGVLILVRSRSEVLLSEEMPLIFSTCLILNISYQFRVVVSKNHHQRSVFHFKGKYGFFWTNIEETFRF